MIAGVLHRAVPVPDDATYETFMLLTRWMDTAGAGNYSLHKKSNALTDFSVHIHALLIILVMDENKIAPAQAPQGNA